MTASRNTARQRADHQWAPGWPVLVLYVVLAVIVFSGVWSDPAGVWIGDDKDPKLFIWYLGFIPHELSRGVNPLTTDYLAFPPGVNLMWNSSIIFPAVLLWPVTAVFGPVASYNVLITASVALSAWLGCLAASRFVRSAAACLAVGFVYGFSPGIVAQALGHPHALIALFPPLVLVLAYEVVVVQKRSPWFLGALAGLAGALQLLTGEELFATMTLVAGLSLLLLAVLHRDRVATKLPYVARAAAAAGVAFILVAGYPLGVQFFGPQRVSGSVQTSDVYVSDLLSFVVPSHTLIQNGLTYEIAGHLSGNRTEDDGYLGVPLVVLFGVAVLAGWRRPAMRAIAVSTLGVIVLSLGPHLHVFGLTTPIPLPWAAMERLPLLGSALPSRLMILAFLGVGIVAASFWDEVAGRPGRVRLATALLGLASISAVFPAVPAVTTPARVPTFFRPGGDVSLLPEGSVVLVTPFSSKESTDAMFWQTVAGYRFRMPEGDAFTPGPYLGPHPSHIEASLDALDRGQSVPVTALERQLALRDISNLGVEAVVAGPSPGRDAIVRYLTAVLGTNPVETEGVYVWSSVQR